MNKILSATCALLVLASCSGTFVSQREVISLEGSWESSLGTCMLPGTTDENKLGDGKHPVNVTSMLTRTHPYSGRVEYSKEIEIPSEFAGKRLVLHMERTKPSTLWIDNDSIGSMGHIYAPHRYVLPEIEEGKHEIKIRIDNSFRSVPREIQGSHAWSDNTQTNWNGILGDFFIEATPYTYLERVNVYPSVEERKAVVKVRVFSSSDQSVVIALSGKAWNTDKRHRLERLREEIALKKGENDLEFTLDMGKKMLTWSEFHPALYSLNVYLKSSDGKDIISTDFGMREMSTDGTQFTINGFKTFLRGKHDACVFPLTGYAPMDVESWRRIFSIAKSYGINYYRCHSYTPPEAAFEAADIEGIYLQPELPLWGNIHPKNIRLNKFMLNEAEMMLECFGNHASFTMMGLGNELGGDVDLMREWLDGFRSIDGRHLYSYGSNNFLGWRGAVDGEDFFTTCRVGGGEGYSTHVRSSFAYVDAEKGGLLNNTRPNTRADYSNAISRSPRPVISHETGQFQIYPDYSEIEKYTGVLYPYNLEIFRDRLKENALEDQAYDFHRASGLFSVECYKADIEYSLRTPGLGGFQMLDLQDYPGQGSALVGILDAFMDSKNLITPEEYRQFCGPLVPLALMDSHCYSSNDTLNIDVAVANYLEQEWNETISWTLESCNDDLAFSRSGEMTCSAEQGNTSKAGKISVSLNDIKTPSRMRLLLKTGEYCNGYNIWVYPADLMEDEEDIHVSDRLDDETAGILAEGGKVLLIPDHTYIMSQSVGGLFTPDYWNYAMFKSISENAGREVSPGTLSLLMEPEHPLFEEFPTEMHSNWQWWSIVRNSRPLILNSTRNGYRPLIQVIDNVERNHKLGLVCEFAVGKGKILICMTDLDAVAGTPEGRQFRNAILSYMKSDDFKPDEKIETDQLEGILTAEVSTRNIVGEKNISDYTQSKQ